eukprot:GFUD01014827.1.p1 GENE.GFUD01014827.1~~GFUD01014827.1.p1  ORF type:complete len:601 (-),score=175.50 GFUD01014827.1:102-1904(-)
MDRYEKWFHYFTNKIKNVQFAPVILSTVIITVFVSVLISVGLSSRALTRRLQEHHEVNMERQRNVTNMLEVMVRNMQVKESEIEKNMREINKNFTEKTDHLQNSTEKKIRLLEQKLNMYIITQNATNVADKRKLEDLADKIESSEEKIASNYETLNNQISDVQMQVHNVENKLENHKVENLKSEKEISKKFDVINIKLSKQEEAVKKNSENLKKEMSLAELHGNDLENLKKMYSKVSLTAIIIAKSNLTDKFQNISDVVEDVQNSIVIQFDSKIKIATMNINYIIDENKKDTLKTASEYSKIVKNLVLKFYEQFKENFLLNLGYVKIPDVGHYLVSDDYLSWFDARKSCERKLGYLVEFKSQEEERNVSKFIKDEFNVGRFWIGALDPRKPENAKITMSSMHATHDGDKCLDHDFDTFCHNQSPEPHPWIMLEYPQSINIKEVVIKNRKNCCGDRFRDIEVRVTEERPELNKTEAFSGGVLLGTYAGPGWTDQPPITFSDQPTTGQFVVIQRNSHGNINIAEISVITSEAGNFVWDYSEDQLSDGYTNWSDGEPSNDSDQEECVEMITGMGWNDRRCSQECQYVCQFNQENEMSLDNGNL